MKALNYAVVLLLGLVSFAVEAQTLKSPDFNGDGVVNVADILLFADVWGTSAGDEKFNARFDLDGDGVIGSGDYALLIGRFGDTVSVGTTISDLWAHARD